MRFTPVTHFASGLIEPCVGALASGSVSSSVNLGGVLWDIYVYSESQQNGGAQDSPSQESFQFEVTKGTTNRAIVGVIGGGGGGASGNSEGLGAAGGGGGVNLQQDVQLVEGSTYSILVGYGANGTSRNPSQGLPFNGTDGAGSSFSKDGGGLVITAGGGEGGFDQNNGSVGGPSGTPTSNTPVNSLAGGGAGAVPGNFAGVTNGNSKGGNGVSMWLGAGVFLRAGGGGNDPSGSSINTGGYLFGGGNETGKLCTPSDGAGSGGSLRTAEGGGSLVIQTFGGGGVGGQHFCNADNTYRSSLGGAGAVFVAIPTNLCSASLYTPKPIVYDKLISYYEMGNPKVVGKSGMSEKVNNLSVGSEPLTHISDLSNQITLGTKELYTNYTGSVSSIQSELTSSIQSDTSFNNTFGYDFYTGSVSTLDSTQPFSVEFVGKDTGPQQIQFWSLRNRANPSADSIVLGPNQQCIIRNNNDDKSLQGSYTESNINQHVITYDGSTTVRYYINGSLNATNSGVTMPSGLTNPILQISEETNFTAEMEIQAFRVYSKELSLSEVQTNYATIIT